MGMYLNPGNNLFKRALNSKIYVDKSGLISYINEVIDTEQEFVCVSRPRRFGKSMAAQMLEAYYTRGCNSKRLFQKLKIAEHRTFLKHLNQHNVIRLDIQKFLETERSLDNFIEEMEKAVLREIMEEFPVPDAMQALKENPVTVSELSNKLLYAVLKYPNHIMISLLRLAMILYYA